MPYITNSDIETRVGSAAYVQLADDDGDGAADTAVVDEIRLAAEAEVDSYLARRFAVPVDVSVHPELAAVLASVTLDLAEYRLRQRRPPVPNTAVDRHEHAIAWLSAVADGVIQLPALTPLPDTRSRGTLGAAFGEPRVLSRDELSSH